MKKNRRILGRALATEISDQELHKACGSYAAEAEEGSCPGEGGEEFGGRTIIVHHTAYHTDCHIDAYDYYT